ncbi:LPXTG cell wall anchor domain-containing protein [Enterococcus mundtii]|uniref:LPXTG-domain-containing protein cell wall anchor domain n=1 Tax=Enterococcus mundtii TaxID=53346 RepID=A0AAI8WBD0_ENTMU|nr:LPXTG cell wall anchor domain-containing protein [Enterococcus mundtii]GEN18198.1 hypothetical protein LAC02_14790 [Ligilactobacillus acidipiscis]AUB51691.1 cell wall protein [Enterococcus mundtii]EOH60391.1 LPXTG-domain-containing protein cell wall anchor domain [Enterococcus mundtii ATCC 882]EOU11807.1 hypothetical protein I587_00326 [Enterococcus mundtii ATCC 882]MCA6774550.1 LPXTG cell wall anchor domain-containing protein [Enterococcus mundtii]
MNRKKKYILSLSMLLIQCYAPLVVYGTEVRSVETEGTVGFTGMYEMPGDPVPAPEVEIKPDFPKEIAQQPSEERDASHRRLPKTNAQQMSSWIILGVFLVIVTLSFWFWKYKKKKQS